MKKNGFIATSLVYSFFLVFIAIVAALLNNYIASKTIIDRFNENAIEELNSNSFTVTIYSKNANIQNGVTLSNLLSNGDFKFNTAYWELGKNATKYFSRQTPIGVSALYKNGRNTTNEFAFQNVHLIGGSIYYFSIDYLQNHNLGLQTYLQVIGAGNNSPAIVTTNNRSANWTRDSKTFTANNTTNYEYRIGDSRGVVDPNGTYFTNAMVINLSAAFGKGYEPNNQWIDKNIRYIDGTVSYLQLTQIGNGKSVEIKFSPFTSTFDKINCISDNESKPLTINASNLIKDLSSNTYTLNINTVESNIVCDVNWR